MVSNTGYIRYFCPLKLKAYETGNVFQRRK